ncbi:hypothetical protein CVM73_08825 [Bradyrhizobium forestalis]|uniref:TetR family transcriptional regulator n=1 Tax=Bradyrhizobium forestalis TaxID=1419263 RepID=A0A2M8RCV3_9BRAD|nr:hypothetical protein [Bradyrhizobium forestalis]PJG55645.1 hypothetical protein CVM73_08825 [Bradyrhizobium forestalis]
MRQLPKKLQPPASQFEKPAKERLIETADKLFRLLGIRAAPSLIAHEAHTNMDTLIKYFGHGDPLAGQFIKSLIAECEDYWRGLAAEYPDDPEAQLREWLAYEEDQIGYMMEPRVLLSRTAAELFEPRTQHPPLLRAIEEYWQAERRRVVGLCKAAKLRDSLELADKLLLLVHGARNERGAYGRLTPSRVLQKAGIELMIIHGAADRFAAGHPDLD